MTDEKNILRTIKRDLPVVLSQAELLAKGDSVATLHTKATSLRIKKKTMTDEISGEIKGVEGAISVLVGQIRTRSEMREIPCQERADYENDVVHVVRLDTEQIIEVRALLAGERQKPLPLKGIDGGQVEPAKGRGKKAKSEPESAGE